MDPFAPPASASTEATIRTEVDARPPRPGRAKALGIAHVVVATLSSMMLLSSLIWVLAVLASSRPVGDAPSMLMGMDHLGFLTLLLIDVATGLLLNGFTFASGLGLINLRAWGARIWGWLAPTKIGRLILVWGGFVIFVAPSLAVRMGAEVARMIQQQNLPGARGAGLATRLGLVYAWMLLAMGIGMIVLGSIYPAATWWLVRRREVRLALADGDPPPIAAVGGEARP